MNDLKYDLRIYVLISSFDPLRIYLFKDGLTRFATSAYNMKIKKSGKFDPKQKYIHLTNYYPYHIV